MRKSVIIVLFVLGGFMLCSCAGKIPPPEWKYEKEAIHIKLKADPQLNLQDGMPHTLMLCTYQLGEPNKFNQLSQNEDGIYKLMECKAFDSSVVSVKSIIVHPGISSTFTLDRAENAKYFGVVAGYYTLQKKSMIHLFDIPVLTKREGFLYLDKVALPGSLNVDLDLGPFQMKIIEEKKKDE